MPRAISGLARRDAPPRHDIEILGDQLAHQRGRHEGVVSVVAVDQHIDVRLDIGEHPAHHIAFALARFAAHDGAGIPRPLGRLVLGIVVVDVDRGVRQRGAEIAHNQRDGSLLIVAGHEDGNAGRGVGHGVGTQGLGLGARITGQN